jgi:hypothetical protein
MKSRDEWAEEHWGLLSIATTVGLAVVISLVLGIGYNVAAVRLDPPAGELRPAPPPSGAEPAPRDPPAPYS